jgi:exosortase H (IPTLxxWG-CTERM-specific)
MRNRSNARRPVLRFIALFALCLLLLALELLPPVQEHVIAPFTAGIAHAAVGLMHPFDHEVIAQGNEIRRGVGGNGISIVAGCSGVEAVLILIAAVLAFPAPWRHKLIGIGLGFVAIQSLNLVRIISLFYLHEWSKVWFDWFHLYLWQALIILDALVFWLIWLRYVPRAAPATAAR